MIIEKSSSNHVILESGSVITYSDENEVLFSIKMDDSFSFDFGTPNSKPKQKKPQKLKSNDDFFDAIADNGKKKENTAVSKSDFEQLRENEKRMNINEQRNKK